MKRIIVFLAMITVGSVLASDWAGWHVDGPPPITLPAAYQEATQLLGVATNEFYCIKASLQSGERHFSVSGDKSQTVDGAWTFVFCNANRTNRVISVFLGKNKKPEALEGGIAAY
jgi:hypothetical protein